MNATTRTAKARKPVEKMHIHIVSVEDGLYTASSTTYGSWLLYGVDAIRHTCECEGNSKWHRTCHHLKAVLPYHDYLVAMRKEAAEQQAQAERDAKLAAARASFTLGDAFAA